jgi:mRNA interferase MazF
MARRHAGYRGLAVTRGDLVVIALQGDFGKPRPALIIQSDLFAEHPSVTILPLTSDLREMPLFRLMLQPTVENGLRLPSQIMIDKANTVPREKVGQTIGRLDAATMVAVNRALALFLGFA